MSQIMVFSPYDLQPIEEVETHDANQANAMLDTAYQAFNEKHRWLKPYQRITILENALTIFKSKRVELAQLVAREGGKPLMDSQVEVDRGIQGIKVAIEHIPQMLGKEVPMNITPSSAGRMAYTFRQPNGLVYSISAFNHPFNLIIHQVIPALAVGCPVIVKPASTTPLSCLAIINVLRQAGLPEEQCQVLISKNEIAEKVLSDPRISFLSFIGSSKVGWYLRTKLPPGARCALEHGGAAPVIFEADADLESALPGLVKGAFYHAGQVCVSVQRIFAHQKISKTLAKRMADMAKQLVVGDPMDPKTEVGPLISPDEVNRIDEWVKEAVYNGAKLLTGGNKLSKTSYEPTVLLDPPFTVSVSKKEIFGPVVCVYSYKTLEQAIHEANALSFYFQASVYTQNIDTALYCVKQLDATAVMVNDHTAFRVDWMPFGGRKQSGLNMGGIPYSMHDMTHERMMVIKSPVL